MGDDEGHVVADHHGRPGGAVLQVLLGPVEGVEGSLPVKEEGDRGVGQRVLRPEHGQQRGAVVHPVGPCRDGDGAPSLARLDVELEAVPRDEAAAQCLGLVDQRLNGSGKICRSAVIVVQDRHPLGLGQFERLDPELVAAGVLAGGERGHALRQGGEELRVVGRRAEGRDGDGVRVLVQFEGGDALFQPVEPAEVGDAGGEGAHGFFSFFC